ncbi:MAG: hypothetical protein R3B40_00095 [Polyangiales bacterium]|nr:hypothetical protein [Myxococcales bacterium]MCB9659158.1 hypothetical protein [Sandaracinaceae bacterium]
MTHTMYLNQHGIPNRSFIDIATRVVPDTQVGCWTREPVAAPAPVAPSFPADDAWRQAETKDLLVTAALTVSLFAGALTAIIL